MHKTFKDYQDDILSCTEDKLTSFLESCFEECPEITEINIIGSTPFFNDGDVCLHSKHINVYFDFDGEVYNTIGRYFYALDSVDKFPKELLITLEKITSTLSQEYMSDRLYGTNYAIKAEKKSGKIKVNIERNVEQEY